MFPSQPLQKASSKVVQTNLSRYTLTHGRNILSGNNIGETFGKKTPRWWWPNISTARVRSYKLNKELKIRVTAAALRTIKRKGGLDNYLASFGRPILGEYGMKLREQIWNPKPERPPPPPYVPDHRSKAYRKRRIRTKHFKKKLRISARLTTMRERQLLKTYQREVKLRISSEERAAKEATEKIERERKNREAWEARQAARIMEEDKDWRTIGSEKLDKFLDFMIKIYHNVTDVALGLKSAPRQPKKSSETETPDFSEPPPPKSQIQKLLEKDQEEIEALVSKHIQKIHNPNARKTGDPIRATVKPQKKERRSPLEYVPVRPLIKVQELVPPSLPKKLYQQPKRIQPPTSSRITEKDVIPITGKGTVKGVKKIVEPQTNKVGNWRIGSTKQEVKMWRREGRW